MHSSKIEKEVDIKSPFTGGPVKEIYILEKQSFKGEDFWVHTRYYLCVDTGEKFTTTEQDEQTINDLYAQFRIKHGIPFPDEIRRIRTKYGLNYVQMGKILGFGTNQYAKYENGQLPSESNGRMIWAVRYKTIMLKLITDLKAIFEVEEYDKIRKRILESEDDAGTADSEANQLIYAGTHRSIYNGFGEFNHRKVEEMVRFFVKQGACYPTKLNKEIIPYSEAYQLRLL